MAAKDQDGCILFFHDDMHDLHSSCCWNLVSLYFTLHE